MLVQHHEKYEEIHGEDKIVMMEYGEHKRLHARLRKEGKCTIPREELKIIAHAAYRRTEKGKRYIQNYKRKYDHALMSKENCITFNEAIKPNVLLVERISVNPNTGTVMFMSTFRSYNKMKLVHIDI